MREPREHLLARLTKPEALERARAGAVGLLPVGALEQHGDHLPLGTDALVAETVCVQGAERARRDALVAPALWSGYSPHHVPFGATVTLSVETFLALVREVVASLRPWLAPILVVNGHGGNRGALLALALELDVETVSYWELAGDHLPEYFAADGGSIGHAGQAETSLILQLAPELVGRPSSAFEPVLPGDPLLAPRLGESGVLGDPSAASAEGGRRFLDDVVGALARRIDALSVSVREPAHAG